MKLAFALLFSLSFFAQATPVQPSQPASGPGGAKYGHAKVRESEHGAGAKRFWLFEPAEPAPKSAPLVIFLHGYSAVMPEPYRAWIEHIVKRGAVVVYPQYQKNLLTPPPEFHANSAASIRRALEVLAEDGRVAPDLQRVAVVGHSAGGVGSAVYAARAAEDKLPAPKAIMPVHAGQGPENGFQIIPLGDISTIPAETKVAVIIGTHDGFVGTRSSRKIFEGAKHVHERRYITLQRDAHGLPVLSPGHLAPLAQSFFTTNALDWYGYWRLFDELCEAAFAGRAFEPSTAMGKWSDGTPVKPLLIER